MAFLRIPCIILYTIAKKSTEIYKFIRSFADRRSSPRVSRETRRIHESIEMQDFVRDSQHGEEVERRAIIQRVLIIGRLVVGIAVVPLRAFSSSPVFERDLEASLLREEEGGGKGGRDAARWSDEGRRGRGP